MYLTSIENFIRHCVCVCLARHSVHATGMDLLHLEELRFQLHSEVLFKQQPNPVRRRPILDKSLEKDSNGNEETDHLMHHFHNFLKRNNQE